MHYRTRLLLIGALDAMIVTISVIVAYLVRFEFAVAAKYWDNVPYLILANILVVSAALNHAKIYRRVWQYASIGELLALFKAITIAQFILFIGNYLFYFTYQTFLVPRSISILVWTLLILGVGGSRLAWRMFRDSYTKLPLRVNNRRTLIIGAGKAGALLVKELKQGESDLYPVAFIDDDKSKWQLEVMGLPVLGGRERILEVVKNHNIQKIVIAMPGATKKQIAEIIAICKETAVKIKLLPRVCDLVSQKISVSMIREVRVEDLLGRDPVTVDLEGIANYVTNKTVLVTGAGGSIGSELCRQIAPFQPRQLLLLGHGENSIYTIELELKKAFPALEIETVIADIQNRHHISEIFAYFHPDVVFHAAAHKHVPLMERNPSEAVKNNILGTKNVAECAHEYGADRFVMVSTDKAVNPTSVMGASKRVAEMIVQGLGRRSQTKFVAVRFGNVLGSRGSVIPVFKRQIKEGGPVTVTHPEMVRYFMTIPEAVQLVIQAGAFAKGGEVFILNMGQPVKIVDLAKDLIRLSGLEPDIDIKIKFTGMRPGEKLYEEILTDEEGTTATKHDRIFVGKSMDFSERDLLAKVDVLEQLVEHKDVLNRSGEIRKMLKDMVPGFKEDGGVVNMEQLDLGKRYGDSGEPSGKHVGLEVAASM